MSDSQKMDLSGVFYIQKQYLTDLSAISSNNQGVAQYLTPLQQKLDSVYNSFAQANTSSSYVLDHQNKMNTIIQNENDRLNQKKTGVDSALFSQRRLIDLNESYRKKNLQYINILIVIVFALLIYLALIILRQNFPIVPSLVFNILIAATLATALILIIVIFAKISTRYEMNFDELKLASPSTTDVSGNTVTSAGNTDLSLGSVGSCIGQDCCSSGTIWDSTNFVCIEDTTNNADTFTSLSTMNGNNHLDTTGTFQPYIPSEFDSYAKI